MGPIMNLELLKIDIGDWSFHHHTIKHRVHFDRMWANIISWIEMHSNEIDMVDKRDKK